jgi:inner membrane protein
MRAHIHILFGTAFVLLFNLMVEMNLEVALILAALFSLLPDIDEPNSISGRLFAPVSKQIYTKYGHRTITHSLASWLLVSLPFFASFALAPDIAYYLWGTALGYLSHIFADLLTVSGIPLAYPWSEKKFVALGGIVDTGKRSHTIITTVFISAAVLLLFQFSQSGWLHSSYGDVKEFWSLNENYLVGVDLEGSWRDTGLPVKMNGTVIKGDGDLVYFLAGSKIYSYSTVLGNQRSSIYTRKAELLKLRPASTYLLTLKPQNGNLDYFVKQVEKEAKRQSNNILLVLLSGEINFDIDKLKNEEESILVTALGTYPEQPMYKISSGTVVFENMPLEKLRNLQKVLGSRRIASSEMKLLVKAGFENS